MTPTLVTILLQLYETLGKTQRTTQATDRTMKDKCFKQLNFGMVYYTTVDDENKKNGVTLNV